MSAGNHHAPALTRGFALNTLSPAFHDDPQPTCHAPRTHDAATGFSREIGSGTTVKTYESLQQSSSVGMGHIESKPGTLKRIFPKRILHANKN